jgi:type II protein arginine methyltransferase
MSGIEQWIAALETAMRAKPDYPYNLAGLAEIVAEKKHELRAYELARKALALADGDPRTVARCRRLLHSLVPRYHIAMMNDARRNAAWDAALRAAIRPGMHVLEIGTGAGILALMAARAGAARVTTCEMNPIVAQMAREIAAQNGFADRIDVVAKRSQDLMIGTDLERPADLLFCDIFGDSLLDFDPLTALADARQRLLAPGAPVVPARGALRLAPAHWQDYARSAYIGTAVGFDLGGFAAFSATALPLMIGNPAVRLLAPPQEAFGFDFSAKSFALSDRRELAFEFPAAGTVNGLMRWIRLDLDKQTFLEARPEPGAVFFSSPVFCPLPEPMAMAARQTLRAGVGYNGSSVETWVVAP